VAAAVGNLVEVPGTLVTLGLWGFPDESPPAAGPLMLQLLAAVAAAGLCRAETAAAAAAAAPTPSAAPASAAAEGPGEESSEGFEGASPTAVAARSGSMGAAELLQMLHLRGERASSDGEPEVPAARGVLGAAWGLSEARAFAAILLRWPAYSLGGRH
jgi:hypothetical protein